MNYSGYYCDNSVKISPKAGLGQYNVVQMSSFYKSNICEYQYGNIYWWCVFYESRLDHPSTGTQDQSEADTDCFYGHNDPSEYVVTISAGEGTPETETNYYTCGSHKVGYDPYFVNGEAGDLHLTYRNGTNACISGNRNDYVDPDTTARDIGAYYYPQLSNSSGNYKNKIFTSGGYAKVKSNVRTESILTIVPGTKLQFEGTYSLSTQGNGRIVAYTDGMKSIVFKPADNPIYKEWRLAEDMKAFDLKQYPGSFLMYQNYPNPFNPATTIWYDLGEEMRVQIFIYNITGERVRTLIDRFERAGRQTIIWDGCDDSGTQVPSGIYMCCMYSGQYRQVKKKMIMVK